MKIVYFSLMLVLLSAPLKGMEDLKKDAQQYAGVTQTHKQANTNRAWGTDDLFVKTDNHPL